MLDKLKAIEQRYRSIEGGLNNPNIYDDPKNAASLLKEQKELFPVVEAIKNYRNLVKEKEDLMEMTENESDPEMKELAKAEYEEVKTAVDEAELEIRKLLLPKDVNDEKSVIMEIRGGAGGEESALFAGSLFRMYSMYAEAKHWKIEIINENETELGGLKEISYMVEGPGVYSKLKFESGVHRVQRVPDTETQGRIHTSTVTVAVLPEAEDVEVDIDPKDLQIDTFRSSGAGGQHINKTESAIRITYLPTGLVVECQDERSQYKNKDKAMKVLKTKLLEQKQEQQHSEIAAERKSQVGTGDRSERIRTYNFPQGRVTDHRIGLTLYKIDSIMNGELDEIIEALITADQAEKLKAGDM